MGCGMLPEQCVAARAMALVDQAELAREAGVRKQVIVDFENGRTLPRDETIQLIQACLESLGIRFEARPDGSVGVFLTSEGRQARRERVAARRHGREGSGQVGPAAPSDGS